LRLNLPITSVRDLVIKDADLVIGTHGRGFWILDDISPLRQLTADLARGDAYLFRPPTAWRFRWNKNTDTPMPPDEPAAPNPPDGVVISYLLGPGTTGPVTLELIETATGDVIRRYSSNDRPVAPVEGRNIPDYWLRPAQALSAAPGLHRFVWDLRYAPPAVDDFSYPMGAVAGNTPRAPEGAFVLPGTYQVRLTVGGRVLRQAVVVRMDPRVRTSSADLTVQLRLSRSVDEALRQLAPARTELRRRQAAGDLPARPAAVLAALDAAARDLATSFDALQESDARPTPNTEAAAVAAVTRANAALADYKTLGP
jgi:hypothetical protein